jgi:hypothetical protein
MGDRDLSEAVGMTAVMAEEFNQLHGGTYDPKTPPLLQDLLKAIHDLPTADRRTALCLSGGGIRSASFALGVLQGLAERQLLDKFHFLSTVSGGGYIGAWLSAWRKCVGDDCKLMEMISGRREKEEARLRPPEEGYHSDQAFMEPVELSILREHSNFLTPKLGALSADTWTLIALYIRNLLLNWAVFLPLIVAALLVPLLMKEVLGSTKLREWVDLHHWVLLAAIVLFTLAVFTSVRGRLAQETKHRVDQGAFLLLELLPIYVASTLVCFYSVGQCNIGGGTAYGCWVEKITPTMTMIAGVVIYLAGWLAAFLRYGDLSTCKDVPTLSDPFPPLLLALSWSIAGAIAGALVGWGLVVARSHADHSIPIVIFGVGWIAVSIFLANAVYLALTSVSRMGDVEREWLARSSGWFTAMTVVWAGFSALVLYATNFIHMFDLYWSLLVGGGAGALAARIGASAKTIFSFRGKPIESPSMAAVLSLASAIFLIFLVIVLSSILPDLLVAVEALFGWERHPIHTIVATCFLCIGTVGIIAYFVNVNRFSAHSLYRNRLIRAFLGSARGSAALFSTTSDPFTGFDRKDNVWVRDMIFPEEKGKSRLFPVINMALNTVAGPNKGWQERKAESFTVSPLRSGNEWVNFWPTGNYGSRENGLGLGTAIAISGAAASPNQGYHSSPLVGLAMTLFNVRLGWWLGNPRRPSSAPRESPPFGMIQFISELFGLTKDTSDYVYLSDGGHFENLGLYEMVRRRCHFIIVSDAGCDPDCAFADLGNAVRKIWIDLGVRIEFARINIEKRKEPDKKGQAIYCAVGRIKYPGAGERQGHIIYLKPGFFGTEPADILAYASVNKTFPHETTADQFFSESQMESYRALGAHVVETVFGVPSSNDPDAPIPSLAPYWAKIKTYA